MPDVFLLALERINEGLEEGERVRGEECLIFEDSVAGVEGGLEGEGGGGAGWEGWGGGCGCEGG